VITAGYAGADFLEGLISNASSQLSSAANAQLAQMKASGSMTNPLGLPGVK